MFINVYLLDSAQTAQVGDEHLAFLTHQNPSPYSDQVLPSSSDNSLNQSNDSTIPYTPPRSSQAAARSSNAAQIQINSSTHAVPPIIEINENDDDDLIFVSEVRLPQPAVAAVIDLCSPAEACALPKSRRSRNNVAVAKNRNRSRSPRQTDLQTNPVQPVSYNIKLSASPPRLMGADCAICLENIQLRQPTSTICGHMFCRNCITQAIDITKRCPICKRKLTRKQIHSIYFT